MPRRCRAFGDNGSTFRCLIRREGLELAPLLERHAPRSRFHAPLFAALVHGYDGMLASLLERGLQLTPAISVEHMAVVRHAAAFNIAAPCCVSSVLIDHVTREGCDRLSTVEAQLCMRMLDDQAEASGGDDEPMSPDSTGPSGSGRLELVPEPHPEGGTESLSLVMCAASMGAADDLSLLLAGGMSVEHLHTQSQACTTRLSLYALRCARRGQGGCRCGASFPPQPLVQGRNDGCSGLP